MDEQVPPSLDEFARREQAEREQERLLALQREAARLAALRDELRRLTSVDERKREYIAAIRDALPLLSVPNLSVPEQQAGMPTHTWLLMLSDWHLGQYTTWEATGRIFHQSTAVARAQVQQLWERLARLLSIHRSTIRVEECVILLLGDLVEGDGMRRSQTRRVDQVVTRQAIEAVDLLAWLLTQCLSAFPLVRVAVVGGNHDRVSERAGYAGLGELDPCDTYAWLIGASLERLFDTAIAEGRMRLVNHEAFFGAEWVAEQRIVYEHGASFRASTGSYGGVSYYAIANAGRAYLEMLEGADLILMGHHHRAMVLPLHRGWQVLNGCLPPSTEFIQSGHKRIVRPSQTLLELHRERGLIAWRPIYLDHPGLPEPGEFWQRLATAG